MSSVRFGAQQEVAPKTKTNSSVTKNPKRPPTLSATPTSAMKSQHKAAYNARVKKRYSGWGETIHGFEGGCQE